jgi:hypothetical protein
MYRIATGLLFLVLPFATTIAERAQAKGPQKTDQPPVERLSEDVLRVGRIRVDLMNREIDVSGTINKNVMVLEFVANTLGGMKAYESAVTLDTDAIAFNTALVLIGLDKSHVRGAPAHHFDPAVPEGDLVDVSVECPGGECHHIPAEQLMFDREKNEVLTGGSWVYTGSSFIPNGPYRAELDGVLIGFVHDPASIIEYTGSAALGRFGKIVLNPKLGVAPGTIVKMTVKALGRPHGH